MSPSDPSIPHPVSSDREPRDRPSPAECPASAADDAVWLKAEIDRGLESRPAGPATAAFWDRLRARVLGDGIDRDG